MVAAVGFTALGAIRTELYTIGLLNFVGLVLFIVGAGGANKYATAPHMYAADMLCVVKPDTERELYTSSRIETEVSMQYGV